MSNKFNSSNNFDSNGPENVIATCFYGVLGVKRDADEAEIKKALVFK
jgi:DnaJ-class molecular chaperone